MQSKCSENSIRNEQRSFGNWIEICIAVWKHIGNVGVATDDLLY